MSYQNLHRDNLFLHSNSKNIYTSRLHWKRENKTISKYLVDFKSKNLNTKCLTGKSSTTNLGLKFLTKTEKKSFFPVLKKMICTLRVLLSNSRAMLKTFKKSYFTAWIQKAQIHSDLCHQNTGMLSLVVIKIEVWRIASQLIKLVIVVTCRTQVCLRNKS